MISVAAESRGLVAQEVNVKEGKLSQNQQRFLESKQWGMEKSSLPKKEVEEGLSSD